MRVIELPKTPQRAGETWYRETLTPSLADVYVSARLPWCDQMRN
jgi:hypothetical protein